jgi:hypothetical protein
MKRFASITLIVLLALVYGGCKKCKNEDPRARIVNNGTDRVSVQIQTSGGNTVNINNIEAGTASVFAYYAPGAVQFTVTFQSSATQVYNVVMLDCYEYDIVIDANNLVSSLPTDRNE